MWSLSRWALIVQGSFWLDVHFLILFLPIRLQSRYYQQIFIFCFHFFSTLYGVSLFIYPVWLSFFLQTSYNRAFVSLKNINLLYVFNTIQQISFCCVFFTTCCTTMFAFENSMTIMSEISNVNTDYTSSHAWNNMISWLKFSLVGDFTTYIYYQSKTDKIL